MADDRTSKSPRLSRAPRRLAAFGALALVAACATDPGSVQVGEPNVPPARYREEILAYLKTYLNDPTGVRDAAITEPMLRNVGPGAGAGTIGQRPLQRYMVCVRFNAKNSAGKYEGSRDRAVMFLAGRLDTMGIARGEQCKDADWKPFPELEKLRR
jgi:hypothetical protein